VHPRIWGGKKVRPSNVKGKDQDKMVISGYGGKCRGDNAV